MKKIFVCFIIIVYSCLQLKPAMTILGDLLAHSLYEKQHLKKAHHSHGHSHLNEALLIDHSLAVGESTTEKTLKFENEFPVFHLFTVNNINYRNISCDLILTRSKSQMPTFGFLQIESPPPQA